MDSFFLQDGMNQDEFGMDRGGAHAMGIGGLQLVPCQQPQPRQ